MTIKLMPLEWVRYSRCDIYSLKEYLQSKNKIEVWDEIEKILTENPLSSDSLEVMPKDELLCCWIVEPAVEGVKYSTEEINGNIDWWDISEIMEHYFTSDRYIKEKPSDKMKGRKKVAIREARRERHSSKFLSEVEEFTKKFLKDYGMPFSKPFKIIDLESNSASSREDNKKMSEINYKIEDILYKMSNGETYVPTLQTMASLYHAYIRDTSPSIRRFFSVLENRDPYRTITLANLVDDQSELYQKLIQKVINQKPAEVIFDSDKFRKRYEERHLLNLINSLEIKLDAKIATSPKRQKEILPITLVIRAENLWSDMVLRLIQSSSKGLEAKCCENEKCGKIFTAERTNQKFCNRRGKTSKDIGCKRKQNLKDARTKRKGTSE